MTIITFFNFDRTLCDWRLAGSALPAGSIPAHINFVPEQDDEPANCAWLFEPTPAQRRMVVECSNDAIEHIAAFGQRECLCSTCAERSLIPAW